MGNIMYVTPADVKNALTIKPKLSQSVVLGFSLPHLSINLITDALFGAVITSKTLYISVQLDKHTVN